MANSHKNSRHSLEEDLSSLLNTSKTETMTLGSIFKKLAGRGYPFLAIFLSLPFCQPIQIPGFSTPFGLLIAFVGLRMSFGHAIWWPEWILKKEISPKLLKTIVETSLWFVRKTKKILRPRLSWLCDDSLTILHGIITAVMGLFLALPLPIPLSNLSAAWAIFLINLGLLECDGLFICFGYVVALITIGLLIGIVILSINLIS